MEPEHDLQPPSLPSLPPGYCWQISRECFDFDIILKSQGFQQYQKHAIKKGLVRDVCDTGLNDTDPDTISDYLYVPQKSPTWLRLRNKADGTASSIGKKIKGSTVYPTIEQVSDSWHDTLSGRPFELTHTMAGHMKWGVGYEDPALIHFAVDNRLSVAQVGTIHLPLSYILDTTERHFIKDKIIQNNIEYLRNYDHSCYLLVSPDGIVGEPDDGPPGALPDRLLGMLEIKCISPFHYMEEQGTLSWVDDMEVRQWFHPGQIPYVYMVQISLQAIAGIHRFPDKMNETTIMWFIRWSPKGFSEFKINYGPLVKMGCVAAMLYFRLKNRLTLEQLPLEYTQEEQQLVGVLHHCYSDVCRSMTHRYVDHSRLYPEFDVYRSCTERHHFIVPHS